MVIDRSTDNRGTSFAPTTEHGQGNFDDKDDINVVWADGQFIDMQVTKARITGGLPGYNGSFCDNLNACDEKRVLATRTSADGVSWTNDSPSRFPDADDPPELQFYRMRPFELPSLSSGGIHTPRLAAHVLLYAPGPVMPAAYGRQPANCAKAPNATHCHAPHLSEEWWVLERNGTATDLIGSWKRPFRDTKAAPPDAWLMAQPVAVDATDVMQARCRGADASDSAAACGGQARCSSDHLPVGWPAPNCSATVFIGNGKVFSVDGQRIGGVYAAANAVVTTPAFTVPATGRLWLDVDARWGGKLLGGGCDEGCQAYVRVGLVDATTGAVLPGFELEQLSFWVRIVCLFLSFFCLLLSFFEQTLDRM